MVLHPFRTSFFILCSLHNSALHEQKQIFLLLLLLVFGGVVGQNQVYVVLLLPFILLHVVIIVAAVVVHLLFLHISSFLSPSSSSSSSSASTLLYPVSLLIGCWDWVQGGDPLYAAVKCLSGCWGQIWRNFSIFFAKRTWHTHFLTGKFFSETKNNFFPPKLAVFGGSRYFSKIEGPFSKIEGPGFERIWLAAHHDHSSTKELAFQKLRVRPSIFGKGPSPKNRSIKGAKTPRKCTKFFSQLPKI